MPTVLNVSITLGDCGCAASGSGVLTYDGGSNWIGSVNLGGCGSSMAIRLRCVGTTWNVGSDACLGGSFSDTSGITDSCDPLQITATIVPAFFCCPGQTTPSTVTITE